MQSELYEVDQVNKAFPVMFSLKNNSFIVNQKKSQTKNQLNESNPFSIILSIDNPNLGAGNTRKKNRVGSK